MSEAISNTDLSRNLDGYLDRVDEHGESFVVQRDGQIVAELRPAPRGVRGDEFLARFRTLPQLSPEEARAFAEDLEKVREELQAVPESDPWES